MELEALKKAVNVKYEAEDTVKALISQLKAEEEEATGFGKKLVKSIQIKSAKDRREKVRQDIQKLEEDIRVKRSDDRLWINALQWTESETEEMEAQVMEASVSIEKTRRQKLEEDIRVKRSDVRLWINALQWTESETEEMDAQVMEASVSIEKTGRQNEADVNQKLASSACVPAVASKEMIVSRANSVDSTPGATEHASKPLNDHPSDIQLAECEEPSVADDCVSQHRRQFTPAARYNWFSDTLQCQWRKITRVLQKR